MTDRLLVVASAVELDYRLGCTPAWWQLWKALYEEGVDLTVAPYLGRAIETPWWETMDNPCDRESRLVYRWTRSSEGGTQSLGPLAELGLSSWIRPRWRRALDDRMRDSSFDAVLFMNVPINHLGDIPAWLRDEHGVDVAFYDGDMPMILPGGAEDRGYLFDYYRGADLRPFDVFFVNSDAVTDDLEDRGARRVVPLHYAADPDLLAPVEVDEDIDVAFYGYGSRQRERWMERMIAEASRGLPDRRFVVGGGGFDVDLGRVAMAGDVPFPRFARFCCRSRINLSITRRPQAESYRSSTARIFELASMQRCIVSHPCDGLETWFTPGEEIHVLEEDEDPAKLYAWLLDDPELREETGRAARERLLGEHTYRHRARKLLAALDGRSRKA